LNCWVEGKLINPTFIYPSIPNRRFSAPGPAGMKKDSNGSRGPGFWEAFFIPPGAGEESGQLALFSRKASKLDPGLDQVLEGGFPAQNKDLGPKRGPID